MANQVAGSQTELANRVSTLESSVTSLNSNLATNETATSGVYRNVWFSDSVNDLKRVHNTSFQYNPGSNDLKVGTINGKTVKEITIMEYNVPFDGWAAGTPGTRAEQHIVNIASDVASYGSVIGVSIIFVGDSSVANYQAFLYSDHNELYVNAYRATANAVGAQPFACRVCLSFAK